MNNIHDVKYLLHAGANINARYWLHDITPLMLAMIKRNYELAKLLIVKGADVNLQMYNGNTALHYAINNKCNNELIKLFIDNNANINLINISRYTPYSLSVFIEEWENQKRNYYQMQKHQ
jgi:ankyrin repeat protein